MNKNLPNNQKSYFCFTYNIHSREKTLFLLDYDIDSAFSKAIKYINLKGISLSQSNLRLITDCPLKR